MSRSDGDALQDVLVWSGDLHGCLGEVGRLSRMSEICREALLDVQ